MCALKTQAKCARSIPEITALIQVLGHPPRHPHQLNQLNSSDAEIIKLGSKTFALTLDAMTDEIQEGLYQDPFTVGWLCAVSSLSDLAAVGAQPIGVLCGTFFNSLSNTNSHRSIPWTDSNKKKFFSGFNSCLRFHKTSLLGGDSGHSNGAVLCSVGFGQIKGRAITRLGLKPGQLLCATAPLGAQALHSHCLLSKIPSPPEQRLRPKLPLLALQNIRPYLISAIDNSDGIHATLTLLSQLNSVNFSLNAAHTWLDPQVIQRCKKQKWPLESLLNSELGDYQLFFSIHPRNWRRVKTTLKTAVILGKIKSSQVPSSIRSTENPGAHHFSLQLKFRQSVQREQKSRKDYEQGFKNLLQSWKEAHDSYSG
jgi:thiamine-monophosphate kinase